MPLAALVGICFAILFYRAASHERMTPWVWAIASAALTIVLLWLTGQLGMMILGQVGLYGVMWWYNAHRDGKVKEHKRY